MDIKTLNQILSFFDFNYEPIELVAKPSGQRAVFTARAKYDENNDYVIKLTRSLPYYVSRIQREISILNKIDSEYFPKIYENHFITQENLDNFFDSLNKKDLIDIQKLDIKPFFITVEEYIENIAWENAFNLPMKQSELSFFLTHIFKALDILWNHKQAHRDLKPDNILIRPNHTPVIIDLGIAKSLREDTSDLTMTGFISPHTKRFASYEQLTDKKEIISYKTDQFSVGLIAYYLLTENLPYGDIAEIGIDQLIDNMKNKKLTHLKNYDPDLNTNLCDFIHKLLEVEPFRRYRNAKKILNDLDTITGAIQ